MIFKNSKIYDFCKWFFSVAVPALGLCYAGLSALWGFPYAYEIDQTCLVVAALFDTLLGISSIKYNRMANSVPQIETIAQILPDTDPDREDDDGN